MAGCAIGSDGRKVELQNYDSVYTVVYSVAKKRGARLSPSHMK